MTKYFVRAISLIAFVALVISISACGKSSTAPSTPTNPSSTGQIVIPAPDMTHLESAFARYHRVRAIYEPNRNSAASVFGFTYLAPGLPAGQTQRLVDCLSSGKSAEVWNPQTQELTCTVPLGNFPTDVEIQVKVGDPAVAKPPDLFSTNAGQEIFINQVKIPFRVTANGEEGYFKLHPDGTPYW
jgi:hypothetical protein